MATRHLQTAISLLTLLGIADTTYLTAEHLLGGTPVCSILEGCETVLTSQYAEILGIPLALFGLGYYLVVLILSRINTNQSARLLIGLTSVGVLTSTYLVYLQLGVLEAICIYCMTSAVLSLLLWFMAILLMKRRKQVRSA